MSSTSSRRLALALFLAVGSGCGTVNLPLSSSFLVKEKTREELRAITADEARVLVREFHEVGGDLAFWLAAIKRNMVDGRGYVLLTEKPVHDGRGRAGSELVFDTTVGGRPLRYLVAVFVTPDGDERDIRTVEYVADKGTFDLYVEDVRGGISRMTR